MAEGGEYMYKRKFLISSLTGLLAVFLVSVTVFAATLVVSPGNMQGWTELNFDDSTSIDSSATTTSGTESLLASGPAVPPLGSGSLKQVVGSNGNDATRILTSDFNGLALGDLTEITYSTYTDNAVSDQAVYLQFRIDKDGDGDTDDRLFYEPVYQNGTYGLLGYSTVVPNQCAGDPSCVINDTWQTWDADAGGWWSVNDSAGGPPLTTLAGYLTAYPLAKLSTDVPSIRVQSGGGAGAWDNFVGYVDKLVINGTTYNFELEEPAVSPSPTITPNPFAVPAECTGTYGAPIVGTNGSNIINGTSGNDLIFAFGGADKVDGKGGDDCIVAGGGADSVKGNNGNDVILGGEGADDLKGENDNDTLYGNNGADSLRGGNGSDTLIGGNNSDSARGEGGSDTCDAESENSCEI